MCAGSASSAVYRDDIPLQSLSASQRRSCLQALPRACAAHQELSQGPARFTDGARLQILLTPPAFGLRLSVYLWTFRQKGRGGTHLFEDSGQGFSCPRGCSHDRVLRLGFARLL